MRKGQRSIVGVWLLVLTLPGLLAAADEVLEVDLGAPEPTATALPAAAVSTPTATAVPVATASETKSDATPQAAAARTAAEQRPAAPVTPTPDLSEVRFDGGASAKEAGAGEGLMIIAPGAVSPEDSLESFGIDSPFNWKDGRRKQIKPGSPGEEGLELEAPESSDLRERVRVESGAGEVLPGEGDFDAVERAGMVVSAAEYRVDGRVARIKDGEFFARKGQWVALRMEAGRQIYPGSIYSVFREGGMVRTPDAERADVGMLLRAMGVVKVVRIEGEEVLARVEKQYETIREGDLVRLRDPDRLRYYNSLRQGGSAPLDLKGWVVAVPPPRMGAKPGQIVYLNLGSREGVFPGLRLQAFRDAPAPDREGMRPILPSGRLGTLEVVNVGRVASTARVVKAVGELRVGDRVRLR
jgi:hypothetical protein